MRPGALLLLGLLLLARPAAPAFAAPLPAGGGDDERAPPVASPAAVGTRLVDNLLARDYMWYGTEALHYAEAAAAVGALRLVSATGDIARRDRIVERYDVLLDDDSALVSRREHVDMAVIGIVPLEIAIRTADARHLAQGLSFADRQWVAPLEDGLTRQSRWWIDDLYMVGMLQAEAFRATGDPRYADRAATQLAAYLPVLQQPNGLFHHSPDVPVFWGRGNGWVAAALAEALPALPPGHPARDVLVPRFQSMMRALLTYQADDGMWRQIVDDPDAWTESSATAMFAYAFAVGLRTGLLTDTAYTRAVERAWHALVLRLDEHGDLADVCAGTAKKNDVDYYLARPRVRGDLHGQAPMLWLAAELLDPAHAATRAAARQTPAAFEGQNL